MRPPIDSPPPGPRRWARLLLWLLPGLVAILFWRGVTTGYFVADDFIFLQYAQSRQGAPLTEELLVRCVVDGTYRPIGTHIYWRLLQGWFGERFQPYHLSAWVLLLGNAYLLTWLARSLWGRTAAGVAAGLLLVTRGALLGNLYWLSTMPDNFMTLFALVTALLFLAAGQSDRTRRSRLLLSSAALGSYVLATLSKEAAAALPILLGGIVLAGPRQDRRLRRVLPYCLVAVGGVLLRLVLCGDRGNYHLQPPDPGVLHRIGRGLLLSLHGGIGGPAEWASWLAAAGLLAGIAWFAFRLIRTRGRPPDRAAWLALSGLLFFPAALLPPLLFVSRLQHYYLLLPLVGLILALAGLTTFSPRLPGRATGLLLLVLLLAASAGVERRGVSRQLREPVDLGLLDAVRWEPHIRSLADRVAPLRHREPPVEHLYLVGFPFDTWISVLGPDGELRPVSTMETCFRVLLHQPSLRLLRVGPSPMPGILTYQELPGRVAGDPRPKAVIQFP